MPTQTIRTRCCIVGGGPAGMMLGLQLARGGVNVVVIEKHGDFLRDFRGDTVHPSTLQILDDLDLLDRFDKLPQRRETELAVQFADGLLAFGDFRRLRPFGYIALVPQWDLLDLLADEARRCPSFSLRMRTEATGLLRDGNGPDARVIGVRAMSHADADLDRQLGDELDICADLVVAADGRDSVLRKASGIDVDDRGAPMDVLWFRVPREAGDPDVTHGVAGRGQFLAMIHRGDYWQAGLVVAKGRAAELANAPIDAFRNLLARIDPPLAGRARAIGHDDIHQLTVQVNRARRWHRPGLLLIGDAAHAMSPIGGVGINMAVQDAVASANLLGPALATSTPIDEVLLARVQRRREWPTRIIQLIQSQMQTRVIAPVLGSDGDPPATPTILRWLVGFDAIRTLPARVFGLGFRRERAHFGTQR